MTKLNDELYEINPNKLCEKNLINMQRRDFNKQRTENR